MKDVPVEPRPEHLLLLMATSVAAGCMVFAIVLAVTDKPSAPPEPSALANDFLKASTRTDLAICVDTIDQNRAWLERASETIEKVWAGIVATPAWARVGESLASPRIDKGCPGIPLAVLWDFKYPDRASPYLVHVYIVDRFHLRGAEQVALWPEEEICLSDQCSTVTEGFYLTPDVLEDEPLFASILMRAMGAVPRPGEPGYDENTDPSR